MANALAAVQEFKDADDEVQDKVARVRTAPRPSA